MEMLNPRVAYGETLLELGKENKNIVALEADLGKSTMSYLFEQTFPDRFFEMGIAEANMTSFAAGLSLTGKIPFVNSFAIFATGRAYDQIRQGINIGKLNVKIVGSSAGLSDSGDGSTHQSLEDVALMRAIPNMTVLVPVDAVETSKMTRAMAEYHGPVYMRLNRHDLPTFFQEDGKYEFGKTYLVRDGSDAVVFGCGIMVSRAVQAAEILEQEGISLKVVNVSTLKPVKEEEIKKHMCGMKAVVTAEEHSIIGGLSCLITFVLRGSNVPVDCIGVPDVYGQSSHGYDELLEAYGLTEGHIVDSVRKLIHK